MVGWWRTGGRWFRLFDVPCGLPRSSPHGGSPTVEGTSGLTPRATWSPGEGPRVPVGACVAGGGNGAEEAAPPAGVIDAAGGVYRGGESRGGDRPLDQDGEGFGPRFGPRADADTRAGARRFFSARTGWRSPTRRRSARTGCCVRGVGAVRKLLLTALDRLRQDVAVTVLLREAHGDGRPGDWAVRRLGRGPRRRARGAAEPETLHPTGPERDHDPGTGTAEARGDGGPSCCLGARSDHARSRRVGECMRWAEAGVGFHDMASVYRESEAYRHAGGDVREAGVYPKVPARGDSADPSGPLGRRDRGAARSRRGELERANRHDLSPTRAAGRRRGSATAVSSPTGWDTRLASAGVSAGQ